ncbi:MAG: response regulator transcription factor [Candidatus Cloacimonetes bacterium]|nr:response regulator transcription factor [Candidatus Cloacimonadota bacterium]
MMESEDKPLVVLIEDDDSVRLSLKMSLVSLGYEVFDCADGTQGLKDVKRIRPNVVIVDYQLPGLDGIEILRAMRKDSLLSRIPVLLLTGFEKEGFREEALREGFVDFLKKPFSSDDLKRVLEVLIRYQKTADVMNTASAGRRRKILSKGLQDKFHLTEREFEVVALLYKGMSTDEIIDAMNIKRNTHKNHMSRILKKVNVKNQTELLQTCYSLA